MSLVSGDDRSCGSGCRAGEGNVGCLADRERQRESCRSTRRGVAVWLGDVDEDTIFVLTGVTSLVAVCVKRQDLNPKVLLADLVPIERDDRSVNCGVVVTGNGDVADFDDRR